MEWVWLLLAFLLGALLVVGAQALLLAWYIQGAPEGQPPPPPPPVPKEVEQLGMGSDCAAALSLALQFLVQELKVAPAPLAWLHRKLSQECEDLLTRTTSGRLFESLGIRSILMGDSAPRVRWAGVQQVDTGPRGRLRTLDLLLDLDYSGGFRLAVDAGMLLGKSACLDIEVVGLLGRARVRFTTVPYTHWSLSFVTPPHLELRARPLRGRLAALLQAHARRALQRKHTLPNYTIRYKPFFTKIDPVQLDPPADDPSMKIQGNFEITLVEVTRLFTEVWTATKTQHEQVYCSLSLDSNPWISYTQDEECSTFTLDIVIHKDRSQQLGTVFKQVNSIDDKTSKTCVAIETVVPLSAAYKADLRRGDILIAVDSKLVSTMSQVAKIVKSISRPCFTVRIERKVKRQPLDESRVLKKEESVKDTLAVGDGEDGMPRRGKSNSFSFRKMSEVLESARNVGQEGRALLRSAHSNSNIQDSDKSATSSINDPCDSQETVSLSSASSKTPIKQEDSNIGKAVTSTPNIISFSKHSDSIQMTFGFGLRKRRCSVENRTSSDSSNSSTPTASSPGTPSKRQHDKTREHSITRSNTEDPNQRQKAPTLESQNSNGQLETLKDADKNITLEKPTKFILGSVEDLTQEQMNYPKISIAKTENLTRTKSESSDFSDLLQTFTTNLIPLSELLEYNEKMCFKLNRNHRYLNLNVWGKNGSSSDETLLAYLNIPLLAVLKECKRSKIGQNIRKFTLLPPEVNLSVSKSHPLASHSGFEPCLCYGDILLSFSWAGTESKSVKDSNQDSKSVQDMEREVSSGDFEMVEQASIAIEEDMKNYGEVKWKTHDFLRTHFHRSTQCDFCGKKIWLKDAVQCRDCALCCHKKCVAKCLSSGRCQPPLTSLQDDCTSPSSELPAAISLQAGAGGSTPEFMMTEHLDGMEEQERGPPPLLTPTASQESLLRDTSTKSDEGLLGRAALAGLLGGLRRVGSAHSLAPHNSPQPSARSLPPSPQHTPRRQSPDDDCAWAALGVALNGGARGAEQLLAPLLRVRQSPELLLAGARDTGPRLLGHLPMMERAERLTALTTEVRMALDEESSKLSVIQTSLSNKNLSKAEKTRHLQSLAECEDRSQALTALLLHCCSAMQSVNRESVSE